MPTAEHVKSGPPETPTRDEWFRLLVDGVVDYAIFALDNTGLVTSWNSGAERLKGYRPHEIIGRHFSVFYPPEDVAARKPDAELAASIADGRFEHEGWRLRKDGSRFWANVVITALYDGEHRRRGFAQVTRDITARREGDVALRQVVGDLKLAHDRFAALIEHSADPIIVFDADRILSYASPALETFLGGPPKRHLGCPWPELVHPDDRDRLSHIFDHAAGSQSGVVEFECRIAHLDGSWRHVEITETNLLDDPAIGGFVGNLRDITERVEVADRLSHQVMHDWLTALPNRRLFLDRLAQALPRAERRGMMCTLFYLDLDRFKIVNDSLGHAAGDQLLVVVAERLREATRGEDTVARLGGDEFVVLTETNGESEVLIDMAERLKATITQPILLGDQLVNVGVSIGMSYSNHRGPDLLLQEADTAMYRAKERGRNRWEIYRHAFRTVARRRLETEALLGQAIADGKLVTLYQPIVALPGGERIGAEALVRIRRDSSTLMTPDQFIDIAEDCGLIVPLGLIVLDDACAEAATWATNADGTSNPVSVNVSPRQLGDPGLASHVADVLSRHCLPVERLCLELTENTLIGAGGSVRQSIGDLRDLGVSIAIDDFGTGWASLSYLRRFPVDILKIDRTFISGLSHAKKDLEVAKAIIGLGHALGLIIVAEGVETDEQANVLVELGCDSAQGYLYAKPHPGAKPSV